MPVTIRVLSWNIATLGRRKAVQPGVVPAQPHGILTFIARSIRASGADLVGLIEVQCGLGGQIRDWLVAELNNAPAGQAQPTWVGVVSARQDGSPQEEYVFLYNRQANRLEADRTRSSGHASIIGVVDLSVLSSLVGTSGWTAVDWKALLDGLAAGNRPYVKHSRFGTRRLTRTLRVVPERWEALDAMTTPSVTLSSGPGLTARQRKQVAEILLDADILRFTSYAERSPFLGQFLVGHPGQQLLVGVFHAKGTSDPFRGDGINVIGLSRLAAGADNLLLMGDFNIHDPNAHLSTGREFARQNSHGVFGFSEVQPRTYHPVFAPIVGAPLNAPDLLAPNTLTTTKEAYLPDNTASNAALAHTYDKFFFRGANNGITAANATLVNLLEQMDPSSQHHRPGLGAAALTYYRAYLGTSALNTAKAKIQRRTAPSQALLVQAQHELARAKTKLKAARKAKAGKTRITQLLKRETNANAAVGLYRAALAPTTAELQNLEAVRRLVVNTAAPAPTGVGTAHAIYRDAISDHLPIAVDLTA